MADLAMCLYATGSSVSEYVLNYYDTQEEIAIKTRQHKSKKLTITRIKNKLEPASYLSRFTDNYYINRVKHPAS